MARIPSSYLLSFLFCLYDVDFSACEPDDAWAGCEKCVIPAHLDVFAGEEFGSALADDDAACFYEFAGIQLNAPVFGIAVSAVSC